MLYQNDKVIISEVVTALSFYRTTEASIWHHYSAEERSYKFFLGFFLIIAFIFRINIVALVCETNTKIHAVFLHAFY